MKTQNKKRLFKKKSSRIALGVCAAIVAVATTLQFTNLSVQADQYDEQIAIIQGEVDKLDAKANELDAKADSLKTAVNALNAEKQTIQAQINLSQAKYEKLKHEIAKNEEKLAQNKKVLGDIIASLYVDDSISPIEMLASSDNVGDFIDKQEFRSAASEKLNSTIKEVKELKKKLEADKKNVERVLGDQKNQKAALAAKEAEKQELLNQTRGEEAAYRELTAGKRAEIEELRRQQQAAIEAALAAAGGGIPINILPGDPNKGGYPWEGGCWVDEAGWSHGGPYGTGEDPLGYGCRQCVSYTAWKVYEKTGYQPQSWGNANMWPGSAQNAGFSIGSTPRAGSVGVISAGTYGHVVWVEAVNSDGTIDVSQYNYYNAGGPGWGNYSMMRVSAASYDTYIYF